MRLLNTSWAGRLMAGCALVAGCIALFLKETAPAKVGAAAGQAIPAKAAA